jgi:hypothetical protein
VPRQLSPFADRQAANARALKSIVAVFIGAIFVFGGFYLVGNWVLFERRESGLHAALKDQHV